MVTKELIEYVQQQLATGVSEFDLIKVLVTNSWTEADAREAISTVKQNPVVKPGIQSQIQQNVTGQPQEVIQSSGVIEPQQTIAEQTSTQVKYAGFWRRFVGWLIDILILTIFIHWATLGLSFFIPTPTLNLLNFSSLFLALLPAMVASLLVYSIIIVLYYCLFEASKLQATVGKYVVGLKITDITGSRISYGKAFLRRVCSLLSTIPIGFGYIVAGFTPRKQTFHDMLTKTVVIIDKERKTLALIGILIATIIVGVLSDRYLGAGFHFSANVNTPKTSYNINSSGSESVAAISKKPQLTLNNAQKEEIRLAVAELHNVVKMNSIIEMRKYLVSSVDSQLNKTDMESSVDSYVEYLISRYSVILETVNEDTLVSPNIVWMPYFDNISQQPTQVVLADKSAEIKGKIIRLSFTKINGVWKSQFIN